MYNSISQANDLYGLLADQSKDPRGLYARNCRLHACFLHSNSGISGYTSKKLYEDACRNGLNLEGSSEDSFRQRLYTYKRRLLTGKVQTLPIDQAYDNLLLLYKELAVKLDTSVEILAKSRKKNYSRARRIVRDHIKEKYTFDTERLATERLLIRLM